MSTTSDVKYLFNVWVLVPFVNKFKFSKTRAKLAVETALSDVIEEVSAFPNRNWTTLLRNTEIHVTYDDTKCNASWAPIITSDIHDQSVVESCSQFNTTISHVSDVIIGITCDYPAGRVSTLGVHWSWPLIFPGSRTTNFDEKPNNPSCSTMVRPGITARDVGSFMVAFFKRYDWNTSMYIYSNYNSHGAYIHYDIGDCGTWVQGIRKEFAYENWTANFSYYLANTDDYIENNAAEILQNFRTQARVSIWCVGRKTMRHVMETAYQMGMTGGDFVFIYLDFYNTNTSYTWSDADDHPAEDTSNPDNSNGFDNTVTTEAMRALTVVTLTTPNTTEYKNFSNFVKERLSEMDLPTQEEYVNPFIGYYYDATRMFMIGVIRSICNDSYGLNNGEQFAESLWGTQFESLGRTISMSRNGDQIMNYSILDMNPNTGEFEHYMVKKKQCVYRKIQMEKRLQKKIWKIQWEDIEWVPKRELYGSRGSHQGSVHSMTSGSEAGYGYAERQSYIKNGEYKGRRVAVKEFGEQRIDLDRSTLLELEEMFLINHRHICKFVGASDEAPHPCILMEYCSRGSLQDLLEGETDFELEDDFKNYLIKDIVEGMVYLHKHFIHHHGNLKSTNCLITTRFAVKISDFGLRVFREQSPKEFESEFARSRNKLWTAPELLRHPERYSQEKEEINKLQHAPKSRDVYSFAIIVQEIIYRKGVFHTLESISPSEKVSKVLSIPENAFGAFRPTLADDDDTVVKPELRKLVKQCWTEDPSERPTFVKIQRDIGTFQKEKNLFDNLLLRLEQYSKRLEANVIEQTELYKQEKEKADDWLYQMLPKSVTDRLKAGREVSPQAFESVTVFFSDIVGFTALSHASQPLEVVAMLNDLYAAFDSIIDLFDVFKVETIGDAYMVVSGLPHENGNTHAREIARMALSFRGFVKNTFKIPHLPDIPLRLRIGIHTGSVVAGIVGIKMPRYCLFGDTVNIASSIESNGKDSEIHLSSYTKTLLDQFETFITVQRKDTVYIEGLGDTKTWWLKGERGIDDNDEEAAMRVHHQRSTHRVSISSLKNLYAGKEVTPKYSFMHGALPNSRKSSLAGTSGNDKGRRSGLMAAPKLEELPQLLENSPQPKHRESAQRSEKDVEENISSASRPQTTKINQRYDQAKRRFSVRDSGVELSFENTLFEMQTDDSDSDHADKL
ncbi:unnamed protein product [Clavelina lepadiformis]|uniref:Guanylate cyclase n=1 Tax=Clavelina lepadiformis TaxID=159417 RepID=A0ABP0FAM9_CLALP